MKLKKIIYIFVLSIVLFISMGVFEVKAKSKVAMMYCQYDLIDESSGNTKTLYVVYKPYDDENRNGSTNNGLGPTRVFEIYKNNLLSNDKEKKKYLGDNNFQTVSEHTMTCKDYLFYFSSDNSYDTSIKKDAYSNKEHIKYKLVGSPQSDKFKPIECKYGDNSEFILSVDENGKITGKKANDSGGYDEEWTYDDSHTLGIFSNDECPAYAAWKKRVANTYLHFENEDYLKSEGININDAKRLTSSNAPNKDQLIENAKKDANEFKTLVSELEGLKEQYKLGNCKDNENTEICQNLNAQIKEKIDKAKTLNGNLSNNKYSTIDPDFNSVVERFNNIQKEAGNLGFEQYIGKDLECSDLETFMEILKDILSLIRIVATVLFIVLGALDFVKATISSDQDLVKKATTNFTKRAIAFVILFLLPIILNIILKFAGIDNPLCGLGL